MARGTDQDVTVPGVERPPVAVRAAGDGAGAGWRDKARCPTSRIRHPNSSRPRSDPRADQRTEARSPQTGPDDGRDGDRHDRGRGRRVARRRAVRPCLDRLGAGGPFLATVSTQAQATWTRNFNPLVAQDSSRWPTQSGFYEPMAVLNEIKGELVPWLATEWAFSADNTQLTFTIREGVLWADGEALDATDVAFTFNYLKANSALPGTEGVGRCCRSSPRSRRRMRRPWSSPSPGLHPRAVRHRRAEHRPRAHLERHRGAGDVPQREPGRQRSVQPDRRVRGPVLRGAEERELLAGRQALPGRVPLPGLSGQRVGQPGDGQRRGRHRVELHRRHREGLRRRGPGELHLVPIHRRRRAPLRQHDPRSVR